MQLTAKQKATLSMLLFAAGVKGETLEKVLADGADFGKESLTAIRAALAGKDALLSQFDALAQKIEKNEDLDNSFKALEDLSTKLTTPAATPTPEAKAEAPKAEEPKADPVKDPTIARAEAILAKAEETQAAVDTKLGEAEIEQHVTASRLPDLSKQKVRDRLKASREYDPAKIKSEIDKEADYINKISGNKFVEGGRVNASFEMGEAEIDNLLLGVQGMFTNQPVLNSKNQAVVPVRSFRELHRLTASSGEEYNAEKMFRRLAMGLSRGKDNEGLGFQASDFMNTESGRLTASLTTSDLPLIFGTAMNRQMAKEYKHSSYQDWRKVSETVNFSDLRTRYFERFGGYAAAPLVAELGTYQDVTSPSEEQVSLNIYKYGHIERITEEMVINDDIRAIQRITTALGRGMAIDVYHMVFDMITNNDAVAYGSDTDTLVHANHANGSASGGTPLSQISYDAAYERMKAQSAFGESRAYLENNPRYLIVGYKQTKKALQIANPLVLAQLATGSASVSEATWLPNSGLPNPYGLGEGAVIELKHITSTTNWWAVADPNELPVILVAFHNGKDTPEIVTEAANTGAHFTTDSIRMKVKLRRGAVINDHRAIDGQLE